jgi:hypothetical protein
MLLPGFEANEESDLIIITILPTGKDYLTLSLWEVTYGFIGVPPVLFIA